MAMNGIYAEIEPTRMEIKMLEGSTVIEFGAPWWGYCQAAQPLLAAAFADHPRVRSRLPMARANRLAAISA
jgi:thioredoxin 1